MPKNPYRRNIMKEIIVSDLAPWSETKWLVLSSCFMLVPAGYAYRRGMLLHSAVLTAASLFSMNYWRHAKYGWRRNVDFVVAKSTFLLFFYTGIHHIQHITSHSWFIPLTSIYLFYKSKILYNKQDVCWVNYHMLFHLFGSIQSIIVIQECCKKCLYTR